VDGISIFDRQGQERDWDWLIAEFGAIQVERTPIPEGATKVYRIVKLQDAQGPAVQIINIRDQEGSSLEGIRVVRSWPDAPALPLWPAPVSMWRRRGVFGATNQNGQIGFGMGHGDYYDPPGGGASCAWVADLKGSSDLISGLGMLGGSPHRHLNIYFQIEDVTERPPKETPRKPQERPKAVSAASQARLQLLLDRLDQIIHLLEERVE
jgi:hypothetical protein